MTKREIIFDIVLPAISITVFLYGAMLAMCYMALIIA